MTETDRAIWVATELCKIYPDRRPLLTFDSPFQLTISVILSAQTTDAQVNTVTPELFRSYPDPQSLANAVPADVEKIVHSTGFFRTKSRNIIGAARAICETYSNTVPESMDDLTSIPGVGRKSANVIRGVVYGRPSIVVDTHLTRVANRLAFVSTKDPARIERELRGIVPEGHQTDFSMSVNLHGRYCCHARTPRCGECVVAAQCPYPRLQDDGF